MKLFMVVLMGFMFQQAHGQVLDEAESCSVAEKARGQCNDQDDEKTLLQKKPIRDYSQGNSNEHRHTVDLRLMAMAGVRENKKNLNDYMDELTAFFQKKGFQLADMEGGTFQTADVEAEVKEYDSWATESVSLSTVCETGFNGGHSALRFLAQSSAHQYEFDLGTHPYAEVAESFLTSAFPNRLNVTWGDSTVTLPQFHKDNPDTKCDLIIVDGGHDYEVALADLKNFVPMAASKHILAIDDTPCTSSWCEGPTKAWAELVESGCIQQTKTLTMAGGSRGLAVGKYIPARCAL